MEATNKPTPITIGVQGFNADLYACDQKGIQWDKLIHLPKFQMYTVQMSGNAYGYSSNVMEWITDYIKDRIQSYGEQNLFDEYRKWHDEKGYWSNETVYGELIQ